MFAYYLNIAWRSLRRSSGLTALMMLAIGFGVAASMTTYSVFRAVSGDPIPWKSSKLFVPSIDPWGPKFAGQNQGNPPDTLTYADAMALMRDQRAKLQSAMYRISPSVVPAREGQHPFYVNGHAVYSQFFPMLDVPFRYGSAWSTVDDERRTTVVVISGALNQELFAGANSVGRTLNVNGKDYRVIGVLDDWNPQPVFYDVINTGGFTTNKDELFMPFETGIAMNVENHSNTNCIETSKEAGFAGLQHSSCAWVGFMAELDTADEVQAYEKYLDGYSREQQGAGRFAWAPNNRLRSLPAWLDYEEVVPGDTVVSLLAALGLLAVCLVNTVGLMLAKFLRRSGEIGLRRALGAPRGAIYQQCLIEAGVVGVGGGLLGVLLTALGVFGVSLMFPKEIATLARLDISLLGLTIVTAVLATVLAGLYPTYRASRVQPALQLKSS